MCHDIYMYTYNDKWNETIIDDAEANFVGEL